MSEDHAALQREAERLGLSKFLEQYPEQFARARAAAARFLDSVPRDLPVQDEPAHTFRANI
jgi:hypothetical protein